MRISPSFVLVFLFLGLTMAEAQVQIPVVPIWEQSFGNREHTNRDELIQMKKDASGNLVLLGFVERDSTFSDVSVQKISPEGNLLWDYRFDSQNEKDYDEPIKMAIDKDGGIIVLGLSKGIVSFFAVQKSNGFLFKVSSEGILEWQLGFDTLGLFPQHDAGLNCDGYADNLGNFIVCYSTYSEFGARLTHFIKFSPEGIILQSFTKDGIAQAVGGGSSAIGQVIDSIGNFVFIDFNENIYPKHSIRTINPVNGADQMKQFNLDNLSFQDSLGYGYLSWEQIWVDDYRELYTANNLAPPLGPSFYLSKVKPDGKVKYIFRAKDSTSIYFNALKPWRGYAYATGSYIPKNSAKRVAFIWKIDGEGIIEAKTIKTLLHDCVPRFLDIVDGKIYWSTEDVITGEATLQELSALDLTLNWEYNLHKPGSFLLTGSNLVSLTNGRSAYAGTLRKEKQPGSAYLSEEDFYVETFDPTSNELHAQYRMSELGTTNVESNAFSIDQTGNLYTRATEADGPEYYTIQLAPRKYYYRKFSPTGVLIWEKESDHQAYYYYGVQAFYFDYQGNAYSLEYGDQSGLLLVKISPAGEFLGSYAIPGFINLFIDRQNRLHLTCGTGIDNVMTTLVLDNNFQQLSIGYQGLFPVRIFQLPSDNAVYYYMEDRADWGESTARMILYKDGQQLWEKVFTFPYPEYQYFAGHDMDATTGTLISSSIWRDNAGFYELVIHKFTIDNNYSAHLVPTSDNVFPSIVAYLRNGSTYLNYDTKLELYGPDFQLLQSIPISNAPSGGYFFKSDNTLFRARQGTLDAYSGDGQSVFNLTHPSFYFDPAKMAINLNKQLITSDIVGDWIGGGYNFGWRWYRSRIQAFDLSNWVTSQTVEPPEKRSSLVCSPNPVSGLVNVDLRQIQGNELQISLFNQLGNIVATKVFKFGIPAETDLDLSSLPEGCYLLEAICSEGLPITQKIVVLRP